MQLTSLSLAISRIMGGGGGAWSPLSLFAAGEQGAWYDPSDLSTLYQDSAGTTPVTAVEQRVGLMLDKRQGLVLGSELVVNGKFDTDINGWGVSSAYPTSLVSWSNGAIKVQSVSSYGECVSPMISLSIGKTYVLELEILAGTDQNYWIIISNSGTSDSLNRITVTSDVSGTSPAGYKKWRYQFTATYANAWLYLAARNINGSVLYADNISIKELPGNHAFQATATPNDKRPILSARVNLLLATSTLSTQSVTTQATSYTLYFTGTGSITLSGTATGTYSAGSNTITCTAGTLTLTVSGSVLTADLRPANIGNNIPAYQRVNTAAAYDTAGFPLYLKADGVYTSMSTNSIDFSATDRITLVTGFRKLSDAAQRVVSELSATSASNNGSFTLSAPGGAATNYTWLSKGTTADTVTATPYTSPFSGVLTGLASISGPSNAIRVNGTATSDTNNQGTGNYGNYPLYLFARNNASLFLNGYFYGAILRGATTSGTDLTNAESYMNTQSGGLY